MKRNYTMRASRKNGKRYDNVVAKYADTVASLGGIYVDTLTEARDLAKRYGWKAWRVYWNEYGGMDGFKEF